MTQQEFDQKFERLGDQWTQTFGAIALTIPGYVHEELGAERIRAITIDGTPWVIMANIWSKMGLSYNLGSIKKYVFTKLGPDDILTIALAGKQFPELRRYAKGGKSGTPYVGVNVAGLLKTIELIQDNKLTQGIAQERLRPNDTSIEEFCNWLIAVVIPQIENGATGEVRLPTDEPVVEEVPTPAHTVDTTKLKVFTSSVLSSTPGIDMKARLLYIAKLVKNEATKIQAEAGPTIKFKASKLLQQVKFFEYGLAGVCPTEWEDTEKEVDDIYQKYLEYREIFDPEEGAE